MLWIHCKFITLSVKTWPVTRKSELYLANAWINFSYESRKRKMDKILGLQSQKPKSFGNLAKGRPVAIFKYFMEMFESFSEFPLLLNYIPMKKSQRSVKNKRPAHSVTSLGLFLHGISSQSLVLHTACHGSDSDPRSNLHKIIIIQQSLQLLHIMPTLNPHISHWGETPACFASVTESHIYMKTHTRSACHG